MSEFKAPPRIRPFELPPEIIEETPSGEQRRTTNPKTSETLAELPRRRGWGRLGAITLLAVLGLCVLQAIVYVKALIETTPLIGWPFAALVGVVIASVAAYVAREISDIRHMRRSERLRLRGRRLAGSELHGEADPLLVDLERQLMHRGEAAPALERFERSRADSLSDGETLVLYERTVIAPLDRQTYRHVLEASRDIGLLTALSPLGLLDGLFVVWRTTLMFRVIARTYGLRLGPVATLGLLRKCIRNAAIAGVADIVGHAAVEHVGASITAMLSARAGQGAGNALLAARLGIEAIRETRPLPFIAEEPPKLRHIRQALFENGKNSKNGRREPVYQPTSSRL